MAIQLFVPNFNIEETLSEIRECLECGWTGLGFKTTQFEDEWKKYTGLENAHFLNSATSGLHLAINMFKSELNWNDEDEIITSPLTFVSTNHAILYENLTPVFADVDEYLCLDPQDVEKKITPRTRAVVFVGLGGNSGRYQEMVSLCKKHGLILILDAAHMAGTRLSGKHIGADADCTVFSFQAVKNLATADSGMICFSDTDRDKRARKLSWLGINKDTYERSMGQGAYKWMYDVEEPGFKYHGNSIMAAMGIVSLRYLDRDNSYRRQLASWYEELFKGNNAIRTIPMAPDCESSRHLFQIQVPNRDDVLLKLNEIGVYPGVHYRDNTEYKIYNTTLNTCPNSKQASGEILSLPMHVNVSRQDIEFIATNINELVSTGK